MFCFCLKYTFYIIAGITFLVAGIFVYLTWFQPPFYFPKPTGQYAVGIKTYHWIDVSRREMLNVDPVHPNRELMVSIWYPAQGTLPEKPTKPYVPCIPYFQKNQKIAWFLVKHSHSIYSYAHPETFLVNDISQFPVIIFSHGLGCTRDSNIAQCEELASNGYIVVGISHTYDSAAVQFPDGRIVSQNNIPKSLDEEIETWIYDVHFVLNQLEQLESNKDSMFYRRFDLKNIGMFGHSYGGATAIQMCRREPRIKAGVNMDGNLYGIDGTKAFDKPCMFMLAAESVEVYERAWTQTDLKNFGIKSQDDAQKEKSTYLPAIEQLTHINGQDIYTFVVKDSGHYVFCDNALLKDVSPVSYFVGDLGTGSIDGFRATEIVNAYLLTFFNKYLKGLPSDLLDENDKKYAEVEIKYWGK